MSTKALAVNLSTNLNVNGIKTEVNQKDVLEVIVDEQLEKIKSQISLYENRIKLFNFKDRLSKFIWKKFGKEICNIFNVTSYEEFIEKAYIDINNSNYVTAYYPDLDSKGYMHTCTRKFNIPSKSSKIFIANRENDISPTVISKTVSVENISAKKMTIEYNFQSLIKSFNEELEEHNKEVKAFIDSFKDIDLSEKTLLKKANILFTKSVIKSNPDLISTLNKTFKTSI